MTDHELTMAIQGLDEDQKYLVLERAAIHEFDGRLSREEANSRAYQEELGIILI